MNRNKRRAQRRRAERRAAATPEAGTFSEHGADSVPEHSSGTARPGNDDDFITGPVGGIVGPLGYPPAGPSGDPAAPVAAEPVDVESVLLSERELDPEGTEMRAGATEVERAVGGRAGPGGGDEDEDDQDDDDDDEDDDDELDDFDEDVAEADDGEDDEGDDDIDDAEGQALLETACEACAQGEEFSWNQVCTWLMSSPVDDLRLGLLCALLIEGDTTISGERVIAVMTEMGLGALVEQAESITAAEQASASAEASQAPDDGKASSRPPKAKKKAPTVKTTSAEIVAKRREAS